MADGHHHHAENRRRPSSEDEDGVRREDFFDETSDLMLRRTNSQELGGVESIAVQETLPSGRPHKHGDRSENDGTDDQQPGWRRSTTYLILLCAFLTSTSFGVTQVPMLYVFRLMTCDAYYHDHPHPPTPHGGSSSSSLRLLSYAFGANDSVDRCSIRPIESATALSVSLLGASTTVFGLLNLFLTSSLIKRIGVKPTLLIQSFFPAVRLLVQNIGVEVWGNAGIVIVQCSQIVSVIGGPSGYMLCLNTYITEVVEYEGRTAALGRLTGSMMFGSALGFLGGGLLAEAYGIKAPFRLTFILFLITSVYVVVFLPHIKPSEPESDSNSQESDLLKPESRKKKWFAKFFGPLAVFAPRKFIGRDGVVRTEYGAFLLAWGVFLGILATGSLHAFPTPFKDLMLTLNAAFHRLSRDSAPTLRHRPVRLWHQEKRLADFRVFEPPRRVSDLRLPQIHLVGTQIQRAERRARARAPASASDRTVGDDERATALTFSKWTTPCRRHRRRGR